MINKESQEKYITYNPADKRSNMAPVIGLPIIINTNSPEYQSIGAKNFVAMICETGKDSFEEEYLPMKNYGDGRIDVQMHHLTSIGIKVDDKTDECCKDRAGSCFVNEVRGYEWGVMWGLVLLLSGLVLIWGRLLHRRQA